MKLLAYQWSQGWQHTMAFILIALALMAPIVALSKKGREDLAAYLSMSLFLVMGGVMIIVSAIYNKSVPLFIGLGISVFISVMMLVFHIRWRKK